ncbi:MAG: hypothetical protein II371_00985 [Flavobacteriales bacterium]|jgi:hypothetical protein|nr:hypothetical protein [Flavobacteriales bacterium]MBQ5815166.1 hypothetical protein [Flavobacteriales bacterium]
MELLKMVVLIALAVYFVADAVLLLKNRQFTVKRSRTWAILISLLMIGLLLWGWFTGHPVGGEKSYGLDGREYFIMGLIAIATIYTFVDFVRSLMKKDSFQKEATNPDVKCTTWGGFVRRKLTFFLFLITVFIFYVVLKL